MNHIKKIIFYTAMILCVAKFGLAADEMDVEDPLAWQKSQEISYQGDTVEQTNLLQEMKQDEMKRNLLGLPGELIKNIIKYISGNDLINTRFVCMVLKAISSDLSILIPSKDESILKLLENSKGALPANFKLLLKMNLNEEQKNSLSKCFLEFARDKFCLHDSYEKEIWRIQSNKCWRFFLMFNYLAEKLGSSQALEVREEVLDEKYINLDSYEGDLIKCDPCLNRSEQIHIFWWEQIARVDADQRGEIIQAYKDGSQALKNEARAQYWGKFDFEEWLLHSDQ